MSTDGPQVLGIPTTDEERAKLAYAVLDQIEAHPETWNQSTWRCSTGMCFAGWTVTLAGLPWRSDNAILDFGDERGALLDSGVVYGGKVMTSAEAARRVLGLDLVSAGNLFHPLNRLNYLKEFVLEQFGPRA